MSKIAIVTGGTRGIGRSISEVLSRDGYRVIAGYGSDDACAKQFRENTGIDVIRWDVTDFDACLRAVRQVADDGPGPSILVNNAGITRDASMSRLSYDDWCSVIDTNLTSVFSMSKAVWSYMREAKFGRIVNISSVNGQTGQFGQVNYAAAKAGMFGLTKSLAKEGARDGITVNAVAPGYVDTDMVSKVSSDALANILKSVPAGRLGEPAEVARVVAFLASPDSSFITGSTVSVNGGLSML